MPRRAGIVVAAMVAIGCSGKSDKPASGGTRPDVTIGEGDLATLVAAREKLIPALQQAPSDPELIAQFAEIDGLSALLYGIPVASEAAFSPVEPGSPGWRAWAIGKAAYELSRLKAPEQLAAVGDLLAELAKTDRDDPWRRWLEGRAALAAGDREGARTRFASVRLAIAMIDHARLLAEDGKLIEAEQELGQLLAPEHLHVLASVERAIVRAELGNVRGAVKDAGEIVGDAPYLAAYRLLVNALIGLANERYDLTGEALGKLGSQRHLPPDCALWERIAWLHLQLGRPGEQTRGDHRAAVVARERCTFYGKKVTPDPRLQQVDAGLTLAYGRPDQALSIADKLTSIGGRIVGAEAALELGKPEVATALLSKRLDDLPQRPEHRIVQILTLEATAIASKDKPRADALSELATIADTAKDQRARHALGAAYFAIGDLEAAKRELRRVVETTSPTSPDPLGYRTHALLAEIALAESDLETAGREADRAVEIHAGNVAVHLLRARILIRHGDADRALGVLAPMRKQGPLSPEAELAVAEALVSRTAVTADQRDQARVLVTGLVGKVPAAELGRVAALVDPKLPAKLKLPVGKAPPKGT